MSKTGISIFAYSIYLGSAGVAMALIPNMLIRMLGLPETQEVWVRLFGFLAFVLGVKGIHGAITNNVPAMQLDVVTRTAFSIFLTVLILLGVSPGILIIFAIIDFAAAVWTQVTIFAAKRRERALAAG